MASIWRILCGRYRLDVQIVYTFHNSLWPRPKTLYISEFQCIINLCYKRATVAESWWYLFVEIGTCCRVLCFFERLCPLSLWSLYFPSGVLLVILFSFRSTKINLTDDELVAKNVPQVFRLLYEKFRFGQHTKNHLPLLFFQAERALISMKEPQRFWVWIFTLWGFCVSLEEIWAIFTVVAINYYSKQFSFYRNTGIIAWWREFIKYCSWVWGAKLFHTGLI